MKQPVSLRSRLALQQTSQFAVLLLLLACAAFSITSRSQRHEFGLLLLICLPLILGIHALTAWEMTRAAIVPVVLLTAATKNIDANGSSLRFPSTHSGEEFDALTTALSEMMGRLEGNPQHMREFLANLSHEIRRPLANMRAESEYGLLHARTTEEHREVLAHQVANVDLITATISDLVQLARCGSEPMKSKRQDQSISELVQASVDAMHPVASLNKIQLTSSIPEGIEGEIDTCQICRVLQNLIDNAIKYNREGGHIHVLVEQQRTSTIIVISDTGVGISAEDLPCIFQRSYRSLKARASQVKGSGLGLYFARMVVEAHKGQIDVESVLGEGTSVRISLPATRLAARTDEASLSAAANG